MTNIDQNQRCRLAVDIGGTFTDVVLEVGGARTSTKVLTTTAAPDDAVLEGIHSVLQAASVQPDQVDLLLHGTTLATNALIERKGARTALVTTEGFRDILEMGFEKRFAQYNLDARRPQPLVPRTRRYGISERISAAGDIVKPLDTDALIALSGTLRDEGVEAVAIGFLHAYAWPQHEQKAAEILSAELPGVSICISSEVCPELREYERFSTTVANAYVRPLMAGYLARLERRLLQAGFSCPTFLMQSGGGLTTLEQAMKLPIRLVESGPAGGAILAADIATSRDLDAVLAFDMGGTTAKIALIDDGKPQRSRTFEIAREYRDMKGSGLPVRIPVIEMVEIGAGGGSIARVDDLDRIRVGPDSAGSVPGPVAYAQGGLLPTVTDANLLLGKLDANHFAGGRIALDLPAAEQAMQRDVGDVLSLDDVWPAAGVVEIVEENMANAARVHAVERGKEPSEYSMIAFGGGAPLHAARLADKLGIDRVIVPVGAGVGSAIGFLRAPVSYQVVRSFRCLVSSVNVTSLNSLLQAMVDEALGVASTGAAAQALSTERIVELRYRGQGHELPVVLPERDLTLNDLKEVRATFENLYQSVYGLTMPDVEVECVSWSVMATTASDGSATVPVLDQMRRMSGEISRQVYDAPKGAVIDYQVFNRTELEPADCFQGPAIVVEDETTTIIPSNFNGAVDAGLALVLTREEMEQTR